MGDWKTVPKQRRAERAAVNATRDFFERHDQVYVHVDQASDYGRDTFVDLVRNGKLTGGVIALQIKGGASCRSPTGSFIPYSIADRNLWVESSVPVFGIVHDPTSGELHWVNLTDGLRAREPNKSGRIEVSNLLSDHTWQEFFQEASRAAVVGGRGLLGLHSDSIDEQMLAVWDCFAIGRHDARALLLLRRSLTFLHQDSLPSAIHALAHCIPFHPDIFWRPDNTVSGNARAKLLANLNWTVDEAVKILALVDSENMFRRGQIGEDVFLLLTEGWGPDVYEFFLKIIDRAAKMADEELAYKSLTIMQYISGEGARDVCEEIVGSRPALIKMRSIVELIILIRRHGWLDIA